MESNNKEKKEAYRAREWYRQKAFLMMFEIAAIIGLPAFAAFFIGGKLDGSNGRENFYRLIALAIAFVFSWVVIIIKYIRFDKKVKEIDKKIRELKEKENVDSADRGS